MKKLFKNLLSSDSWGKHFSETVRRIGKNNAGFSLVELIVVIAIMAILAAVAVIGVSVYIPKTQKAADEQMIADIQKAINLYTSGETLTPGQSGYVVVRKAGGVAVGGSLDAAPKQLITNALKATFGEDYTSELKVAYKDWTGTWNNEDAAAIGNSVYINNIDGKDGLLETVQMLTDAMKGYYNGNQVEANNAVLEVAAGTQGADKEKFINWWMDGNLDSYPPEDAIVFAEGTSDLEKEKVKLAALYAKGKAFVLSTNCEACNDAFTKNANNDNKSYFEGVTSSGDAQVAIGNIATAITNHLNSHAECGQKYSDHTTGYFSVNGSAKSDAEAYIALLGKIDSMSETIIASPEFQGDGLFTSDFVKDYVNEYKAEIDAYMDVNAQVGDIVITVVVDQKGNLRFKGNLTE